MSATIAVSRGTAPLLLSLPHTGEDIPDALAGRLSSPWLARKDVDWWVDRLYAFASDLGATIVRTPVCRTVIDVNRDPSGASLYPGQATTGLCPDMTFDGEPLYSFDRVPDEREVAARRAAYFAPYHAALSEELARLRGLHERIVLYDAHSIRSHVPRLFEGTLAHFNIGVNGGTSCDPALTTAVETACASYPHFGRVTDGRFRGGWITRHYGRPSEGVHALQMELACRGYMDEPADGYVQGAWPTPYHPARAAPMREALRDVLLACLAFASSAPETPR